MRILLFAITLLIACPISSVWAQTTTFHAGIARISVPAEDAFDMLIWYPTQAEEVPWQVGPFTISASRDAVIAPGQFPVVLLSHGGGQSGGSPLLLRELSGHLARQGFIVVAPFHGKARLPHRPVQIEAALDVLKSDPRFKENAATGRLGMLGFSLGGAVALGLAGAVPDFQHLAVYCADHPDDVLSCGVGPSENNNAPRPAQSRPPVLPHLPLKALALLDPFGILFQREGLAMVKMPVLLVRPEQSRLGGENMRALAEGLPQPPEVQHVPGGHFIFTDVCPAVLKTEAPEVCEDAQGVDRAAIHLDVEAKITQFFRDNL